MRTSVNILVCIKGVYQYNLLIVPPFHNCALGRWRMTLFWWCCNFQTVMPGTHKKCAKQASTTTQALPRFNLPWTLPYSRYVYSVVCHGILHSCNSVAVG